MYHIYRGKTVYKGWEIVKKTLKQLSLVLLIAALMLTVTGCGALVSKAPDYEAATQLMENGDYAAASEIFKALGRYKGSADLAKECDYMAAMNAYDAGDYDKAMVLFHALGDYKDSTAMIQTIDQIGLLSQRADKELTDKLPGIWVSDAQGLPPAAIAALDAAFGGNEDAKLLLDCLYENGYLTYTIEFPGDGTFVMAPDAYAVEQMLSSFYGIIFSEVLGQSFIADINREAAATGYTAEDLYRKYNCSFPYELWGAMQRISMFDYIATILPQESVAEQIIRSGTVSGECAVKYGNLRLTIGNAGYTADFDDLDVTLTLDDKNISDTPIVFSRA